MTTSVAGQDAARERSPAVVVLGIGNLIMGDDGTGPELLARLRSRWGDDPRVEFVDGGIQGMELLPTVQEAQSLLLLDAIAPSASTPQPGTALRIGGDQVPRLLAAKLSPHQVGMLDVLAAARLTSKEPERVEVVGIVPGDVDIRIGLSPAVVASLEAAVDLAVGVLQEWLGDR